MDIGSMLSGPTFKQNSAEMFRTNAEVDRINKTLNREGKEPVKEMGKDEFLQLLVTELQHQDPTNPMNDREFIAQMAQFSSLEQMLNFNTNMSKLVDNVSFQSSFNLIGMNVDIQGAPDENGVQTTGASGMVESVSKRGNMSFVKVNGEEFPVTDIIRVGKD